MPGRTTAAQMAQNQKRRAELQSAPSSLLRSERMVMLQLIGQHEAAQDAVEELGELGSLMFVDLNAGASNFKRHFIEELRCCEEMERHLRYMDEQLAAARITPSRLEWSDADADTEDGGSPNELKTRLAEQEERDT